MSDLRRKPSPAGGYVGSGSLRPSSDRRTTTTDFAILQFRVPTTAPLRLLPLWDKTNAGASALRSVAVRALGARLPVAGRGLAPGRLLAPVPPGRPAAVGRGPDGGPTGREVGQDASRRRAAERARVPVRADREEDHALRPPLTWRDPLARAPPEEVGQALPLSLRTPSTLRLGGGRSLLGPPPPPPLPSRALLDPRDQCARDS